MSTNAPIVCKLGGSLLDLPDLAERFAAVLGRLRPIRCVLVVGGGRVVDALRHYDAIHGWSAERSHAMAVRALRTTEDIALTVLGVVEAATAEDVARAWSRGQTPLLRLSEFVTASDRIRSGRPADASHRGERTLRDDRSGGDAGLFARSATESVLHERRKLGIREPEVVPAVAVSPPPAGWHVTSDSLAAWLAIRWASELLLLKSIPAPANVGIATESGALDAHFPTLASSLRRMWWANLRADPPVVRPWPDANTA